jgi:hypothetical protein
MDVEGYSERGALAALVFDIARQPSGDSMMARLLSLADWPWGGAEPPEFSSCERVFIEQSLSDFGDPDLVTLCTSRTGPECIFWEAKRGAQWKVQNEVRKLDRRLEGPRPRDGLSLFEQLYLKQRFARAVAEHVDPVQVEFDPPLSFCRGGRVRNLGENPVVLKALRIMRPYIESGSRSLMVLPKDLCNDDPTLIERVCLTLPDFDLGKCGILSWQRIYVFCRDNRLEHATRVLDFNEGQMVDEWTQ